MEPIKPYENFPVRIVIMSNLVSVLIYVSGFIILLNLSWIAASIYTAYIIGLEYRLISRHCINCYYYGRLCGFGQGRLSSMFFKKGDPAKFCENPIGWKDMIPDLLVSLIPFAIAVILLIIRFNLVIMAALLVLIILSTIGNSIIRGSMACKYCKQRESGCPAEQLFSKK